MSLPQGVTPKLIGKVVSVQEKDLDSGITAYTTGTLESFGECDGDWAIRLTGGLLFEKADDVETKVVSYSEPKIELARTRKPSHF